MINNQKQ